jgi:hypothetical protein
MCAHPSHCAASSRIPVADMGAHNVLYRAVGVSRQSASESGVLVSPALLRADCSIKRHRRPLPQWPLRYGAG